MTRTLVLALLAVGLFAQAPGDGLCLGPLDKDGSDVYVVCPPSPETRIAVLEANVAQLEAVQGVHQKTIQVLLGIVKELAARLKALEGKAAYPGFVGTPQ